MYSGQESPVPQLISKSKGEFMGFICGICNTHTDKKSTRKQVTKKRLKVYPSRHAANTFKNRDGFEVTTNDPGGNGWEIVSEVLVCAPCDKVVVEPELIGEVM